MKILLLLILPAISFSSHAQVEVEGEMKFATTFSSSKIKPHWIHSNNWGLTDPFGHADALVNGRVELSLLRSRHVNLMAGTGLVVRQQFNESFLHEAYLSGNLFFADFVLGKKAFSPLAHLDHIGTGSYLMSSNARPIPKASFGIFEYRSVPFTNNWLEVKGYASIGFLNEDPAPRMTGNVWCHEKFGYIRLGKFPIKPYIGLVHVALLGGENFDGSKIPVDFWATFLARGSERLGEGELTNAAGAHDGLWDFGVDAEFGFGNMHVGLRKPFSDRNGYVLKHAFQRNKDYILTLHLELNNGRLVNEVLVEFFKTDHQTGPGIPDPLFPPGHVRGGQMIFPWLVEDWNAFMSTYFPEIPVPEGGWNTYTFERYWEARYNHGYIFGGRADYLNNGFYYRSYTAHGQSMGTSLFHTYQTVRKYAPGWQPNNHGIFINNRVRAFHVGIAGQVSEKISYRLKATHSLNDGNWGETYLGRYSWELSPANFFATTKSQTYTLLEINHSDLILGRIDFTGSIGFDFGELYNSGGLNVELEYRF